MAELLEREDLLAELETAAAAGGRLVFVGGEAGVGKTALVRALGARIDGVRFGACENLEAPTPLGPFLDLGLPAAAPRGAATAALEAGNVLVVEDVHWADGATLDALRVLGRRIDGTRTVMVATYRDDEVAGDHPLRVVLGELASTPGVTRLSVPPLSLDAVRVLAEPRGADAEAIHRLTQGNAFYVTEILAATAGELPETVRDAVLARVALLGEEARRLLDAIAVAPGRAELWLLEEVAAEELEHLEECLESGVVRADGDGVAFRHELGRLAVESVVAPHRRRALHAAMLEALGGRADPARLAHHAEEAGDADAVLRYAPEAARAAVAASAHREAAAQYARALRHGTSLSAGERGAMLVAYAVECEAIGRSDEAIESRTEAIELFELLGDELVAAETRSRLVIPLIRAGRNDEAEEASRTAIAALEAHPPGRELGLAYADQAYIRMIARDNADGVAWGEKAVAAARTLGDPDLVSYGLNMVGTSYVMAGEIDRGKPILLEALDVARHHELELRIASALGMLGSGLGEMFELPESRRYLLEGIEFAEAHDFTSLYAHAWLALVDLYEGRWDDAAAGATRVLVHALDPITRVSALIALGRVRARRGDPGAFEPLDVALELALPGGHLQRLGHVHAARAEAAWLADDQAQTLAEAQAVYELALEKRHLWFTGELAYWQARAGESVDVPDWVAGPWRLQLAGDAAGAAAAWRERGCPYESARALADAGDEAALEELDRLGARPLAAALRKRLGLRGPRATTREHPAGLTARELEVLELLGEGLTNAEIAGRLVISEKTVGHHVSAILRKLGVESRYAAAKLAAQDREPAAQR